jgi:hypothetical protein
MYLVFDVTGAGGARYAARMIRANRTFGHVRDYR